MDSTKSDYLAGLSDRQLNLTKRVKRNITLDGVRTTLSLETAVWDALTDISVREQLDLDTLCQCIVSKPRSGSRAAALRVFGLDYYKRRCGSI